MLRLANAGLAGGVPVPEVEHALVKHVLPMTTEATKSLIILLQGLLVAYPLLWWSMYSYMLQQRRKKLKSE